MATAGIAAMETVVRPDTASAPRFIKMRSSERGSKSQGGSAGSPSRTGKPEHGLPAALALGIGRSGFLMNGGWK